jgi:hypothetical protein
MVVVSDIVVGLLAILVGALFCFRGYLAMRLVIPVWGALAGFVFGAGLVSSITDEGFLSNVVGWFVGLAFALVFAAIAYLYYEVAVLIGMAAIGFALGTSVTVALGVRWSWVIVLVGVVVGALLAFVAIAADLPMVFLTLLTALAGSSTVVTGLMLLFGVVSTDEFDSAATTEVLDDDWWWYGLYVVIAVAGVIAQLRDTARFRASMRSTWSESGGRELRTP